MNMNLNQLAMLQKLKSGIDRFRANHPQIPVVFKSSLPGCAEGRLCHRNQRHDSRREELLLQRQAERRRYGTYGDSEKPKCPLKFILPKKTLK